MKRTQDPAACLQSDMKRTIRASIEHAFSRYMYGINWQEDAYESDAFVSQWLALAKTQESWHQTLSERMGQDPRLEHALIALVNDTIRTIFETPPTPAQMAAIDRLNAATDNRNMTYSCRLEADYVIDQLKHPVIFPH